MRICLIGTFPESPQDAKGGVAKVIFYLAQSLVDLGHEVHVMTVGIPKAQGNWTGFKVHYIRTPKLVPRLVANLTIIKRRMIMTAAGRISADIYHFHGSAMYYHPRLSPSVLTIHGVHELDIRASGGSTLRATILGGIERHYRNRIQNTIIISRYIDDFLSRNTVGKRWIVENPVSNLFFEVERRYEGEKVVFYGGMLSRRKNIMSLLKTFFLVSREHPDAKLRLAGPIRDPGYVEKCRAYIRENGIEEKVDFLGSLDTSSISKELSSATCVLLLSLQETAPLIITEAMAAGVPVVSSNAGGCKYLVEHGETGFIVDATDIALAAEKVTLLLGDSVLARKMGSNARIMALRRFRSNEIARSTERVYQDVIDKSN